MQAERETNTRQRECSLRKYVARNRPRIFSHSACVRVIYREIARDCVKTLQEHLAGNRNAPGIIPPSRVPIDSPSRNLRKSVKALTRGSPREAEADLEKKKEGKEKKRRRE
jgi:hypothetical protein